jgi:cytochrome oxidase Cu insertion factor (SCO1/SenC/PrrC family)
MTSFIRSLALVLIGVMCCAALAYATAATITQTVDTAMPGGAAIGGPFSLYNQQGKPVTEKSWPGHYKLVFFGYTHCPDTCPATLQKLTAVMQNLDPKGEKIVPLFVTVDPARDTAKVLSDYLSHFSPTIVGLTGTDAQIKGMEETYKVYAAKQPGQSKGDYAEYLEDHSAYVYLMSPDDKLLQTFSFDETAEAMIGKIKDSVK